MTSRIFSLVGLPVLSFGIAVVTIPLMRRLAARYGIGSAPYNDLRNGAPTPLMGGASIVGAIVVALAFFGKAPVWMLVGTSALFAVGLLDDVLVLRPLTKLSMQLAVVIPVAAVAPRFKLAPWPALNFILVAFWLLSTVNAFNLIDGLDGLAASVGIAASAAITAIALAHRDFAMACEALVIMGSITGFILYNWHPASIFMGDCGALPLGLLFGIISLRAGSLTGNSRLSPYAVPILIMLVPLLDTAIVSVSRMATGIPVSRRGLDHSHHRLLSLGLAEDRVVLLTFAIALMSAACAVAVAVMPHAWVVATIPFVVLVSAIVGLFMIDLTFESNPPGVAYGYLQGFARFILTVAYKRRLVEAVLDVVVITAAFFGSYLIRLNFAINDYWVEIILGTLPWVILATYPAFIIAGIYRGIWRYIGFSDVVRFANGSLLAGAFILAISFFVPTAVSGSIAVLYVILLFNLLVATRLSFRALRKGIALLAMPAQRVLVVGAGELAEAAARYLTSGRSQNLRLVGFVDDDSFKLGKFVHGCPVLGSLADLEQIRADNAFDQLLVANDALPPDRMSQVWSFANQHHLSVQRFSMRLNQLGMQAEMNDDIDGSATDPGSGKVVA